MFAIETAIATAAHRITQRDPSRRRLIEEFDQNKNRRCVRVLAPGEALMSPESTRLAMLHSNDASAAVGRCCHIRDSAGTVMVILIGDVAVARRCPDIRDSAETSATSAWFGFADIAIPRERR
jgi:hypothetical protein